MATRQQKQQAAQLLQEYGSALPAALRCPLSRVSFNAETPGIANEVLELARNALGVKVGECVEIKRGDKVLVSYVGYELEGVAVFSVTDPYGEKFTLWGESGCLLTVKGWLAEDITVEKCGLAKKYCK